MPSSTSRSTITSGSCAPREVPEDGAALHVDLADPFGGELDRLVPRAATSPANPLRNPTTSLTP